MATTRYGDLQMLVAGELATSADDGWLTTTSPVTEEALARVPDASAADVDMAVRAGLQAHRPWADRSPADRGDLLRELARRLASRADELIGLEVLDTGTTIRKMRRDVQVAVDALTYYAGLGHELKGTTFPPTPDSLHFSLREPYGVVGRIVAFNHPIAFLASRMAAPLMAGNAVVMKAPDQTPLSATVLAQECAEVFPRGLVSILTGRGTTTGAALVRHPAVRRLTLIGSVPTGLAVQRAAAEVGVKHVTLELGGKNPMVVFPDADLQRAIPAAVDGMNFAHQGQSCGSTSRLFLHDDIYDHALEEVVARVEALRVGDPADEATDMGALVSAAHLDKVEGIVAEAIADGARLAAGGRRPTGDGFERGFWYRPTVFADVTPGQRVFDEEIFGPVLSVVRWRDEDELFRAVNAVDYGLTAAIWTESVRTAFRAARAVEAGYVWINGVSEHFLGTDFGGRKDSGLGTEEGLEELLTYTQGKTVHLLD